MIKITVNSTGATRKLAVLADALKKREAPNKEISVHLYSWVMRNFDAEGSPTGKPWAPLKESTARRVVNGKQRGYHPILQVTGELRISFSPIFDNKQAGVGVPANSNTAKAKKAAAHQYGVPENNLPARPMLPNKKQVLDIATRVYGYFVAQAARK